MAAIQQQGVEQVALEGRQMLDLAVPAAVMLPSDVEILAPNQQDFINVLGSANIDNSAMVNAINGGGVYPINTSFSILHAANGITGQYSPTVLQANTPFLNLSLTYEGGHDVFLHILRNNVAFANAAITPNQIAVANAIDAFSTIHSMNLLYNTVSFLNSSSARAAFDQLSGEMHASVLGGMVEESRYLRDAVLNRLVTPKTTGFRPLFAGDLSRILILVLYF